MIFVKQHIIKILSACLALLLLLPAALIPASADSYVTGTNGASESYMSGPYYERLLSVPTTGDGRTDVLAVALSQLGYQEGDANGEFSGTVAGSDNYTEYNYNMGSFSSDVGYGTSDYNWCASFVSFCLLQARCHTQNRISDWCRKHEGDSKYIWREVSCNKWATQLRTCGYFEDSAYFDGDYSPLPGDLIFFTKNGTLESHIGFVLYTKGSTVYTVEGNTSSASELDVNGGGVYMKSYSLSSSYIRGYGVLPYKVSNDAQKIDYSGGNATPGLYVATTNKYVYISETALNYTWLLPRYSVFEVTDIVSNGRVKAVCEINGKTVTGYIKNNTDRIVQISASEDFEPYQPISEHWGYISESLDFYHVNSVSSAAIPDADGLTVGDKIGINGWVGLTREVSSVGYFFDDRADKIYWDSSALSAPEAAVESAGGEYAMRYKIMADTSKATSGSHTVTFVAKLADGTIGELETLEYRAKYAPGATPVTTEPEETTKEPVVTTTEQEESTTEPDKSTTEPDVTTKPAEITTEPEDITTKPEEITTEPDVTTEDPDEITSEPDVTTEEPDNVTTEADGPSHSSEETTAANSDPSGTESSSEQNGTEGTDDPSGTDEEDVTDSTESTSGEPTDGTQDVTAPDGGADTDADGADSGCFASTALPALLFASIPMAVLLKKRDGE